MNAYKKYSNSAIIHKISHKFDRIIFKAMPLLLVIVCDGKPVFLQVVKEDEAEASKEGGDEGDSVQGEVRGRRGP